MQDEKQNKRGGMSPMVKWTAKDSVFIDLFRIKKNLLKLYQTLHPEDTEVTEDSLKDVTIKNILTDNLYNDLGFMVGNRLLILVEAQSTWTMNILVRVLLYLAQSYHEYFLNTGQNYYKSKKVEMPKPEIYVIFTGERVNKPEKISLSEEFFAGEDIDLEIKAKIIYESDSDDIINQYIIFCKVFNEQVRQHGMTSEAVEETIRICRDRNILREYLSERKKEVLTIMKFLFDQEEVMEMYVRDERNEAAKEATQKATQLAAREREQELLATATRLIRKGKMSLEDIADCIPSLSIDELKKLEEEIMRPV